MRAAGETIRADADGVVIFDVDVAASIVANLKMADEFHLLHDAEVLAHELELNGDDLERAEETMIMEYGLDHTRFVAAVMLLRQTQTEMRKHKARSKENTHPLIDTKAEVEVEAAEVEQSSQPETLVPATTGKREEGDRERRERLRREQEQRDKELLQTRLARIATGSVDFENNNWRIAAKCADHDPELFFPVNDQAQEAKAKNVCGTCTVSTQCLAEAIEKGIEHGVWGGSGERERRALVKRRMRRGF